MSTRAPVAAAAPPPNEPARSTTTWERNAFALGLLLTLASLVVAAVWVAVHGSGALIRDEALIELRVRDVGRHPTLLGLYSRDGWSHPGPLLFYTLALPYRLLGSSSVGLLIGALIVNAAAITGMALIAKRVGGLPAALVTLIGAGLVTQALGVQVVSDPWVCYITVLPFGLFCYLVWAMTDGAIWALPTSVVVASWLAQTHIGYAPLVAPLLALGAIWLWVGRPSEAKPGRRRRIAWASGLAVVVFVLLWLPVLWDQWRGSGNLEKLIDWFTDGNEQSHSLAEGARIVFGQFALAPDWVTGTRRAGFNGETTLLHHTLWPVLVIPFIAAAVIAWRQRRHPIVRLTVVTGFGVLVAVLAVTSTLGIMYEYRLLWIWLLGMLAAVVIAWTAWSAAAARWPQCERRVLVPLSMIALVAISVVAVVDIATSGAPDVYSPAAQHVTQQLRSSLGDRPGPVVLRSQSSAGEWYLQGVLLGLERDGVDARVPEDPTQRFGVYRVARAGTVATRLLVLADDDIIAAPPGLEVRAYSGPLPLERYLMAARRAAAQKERLLRALQAGTITPPEYVRRLARVKPPGPTVVVLQESSTP